MGSGHFLVFALPILIAFRMTEEGLSRNSAVDAVLRDNIYGLEIDPRCTQIAAFNLAFAVWRIVGFRQLPPLHIACSGLALGVSKVEWLKLAAEVAVDALILPDGEFPSTENKAFSERIKSGLERIYDLFDKAPILGSLIDPRKASGDLYEAGFHELEPLLTTLLAQHDGEDFQEMAVVAQGLAKASEILGERFTLVITNVPYLGIRGQNKFLTEHCSKYYDIAKGDVATVFLEKFLKNNINKGGSYLEIVPEIVETQQALCN